MISHFSGKRMAMMCTMIVSTGELIPTCFRFETQRRVMKAATDAEWGMM